MGWDGIGKWHMSNEESLIFLLQSFLGRLPSTVNQLLELNVCSEGGKKKKKQGNEITSSGELGLLLVCGVPPPVVCLKCQWLVTPRESRLTCPGDRSLLRRLVVRALAAARCDGLQVRVHLRSR